MDYDGFIVFSEMHLRNHMCSPLVIPVLPKRMGRIFSQFWWRNMVENDTNATTVLLDS
jgi:hypothetical protein